MYPSSQRMAIQLPMQILSQGMTVSCMCDSKRSHVRASVHHPFLTSPNTAYEQEQQLEDTEYVCYTAPLVSDDTDEKDKQQQQSLNGPTPLFTTTSHDGNLHTNDGMEENNHNLASPGTELPIQSPVNVISTNQEEDSLSTESPQTELPWWHYHTGKCYFTSLRLLTALVILPRNFLKVNPPKCAGCLYGATT